jgi:conjugative relaxase-like TrwC/TraI family protein
MFTATALKNKAAAKAYFDEHLSHNDYYTEGEVESGHWIGLGAEQLGLKEGVDQQAFLNLCDGLHPSTNERLTQRHNAEGNRRVFFDFTCSAPKSVSVMAVTMNDARLVEAHRESTRVALKELERFAAARIRARGADADRTTGNVIGAEFLHTSSRALDPQLHTHFTLFNATFDAKENRWKALQTSDIFAASQYGTEVYRNELSRRLQAIGYEMEGIEIKGVSPELMKRFSKRSAERDAVIAQMEERLGRKLSNNEISLAVHKSRSEKVKGISTAEVRQMQLDQMTPEEIVSLRTIREQGIPRSVTESVTESAALRYATAHVFERASVVPEPELLRHALMHGRGQTNLAILKSQVANSEEFIRVGKEISTREILTTELFLIEKLNEGQNAFAAIAPNFVPVNPSMGTDQRRAIAHILQSPDQFTGFRGLAGSGKTTALKEIDEALKNHASVFCAPTAAATEVLRKDGFCDAVTLKALLVDPKHRQKLKPGSVIVLDEAGLVGLGDMKELFTLAVEKKARVVFSGDTGQHTGVARGDALRLLEEHSLYRFGQLDQIRRQQQADYRQTVELAARQRPREAFDRLDALGCVEEPSRIYETAATAYLDAQAKGKSALLVAPTWAEIDAVTECVRLRLKETGALAKSEERVSVFDSLGWTEAQKGEFSQYRPGQQILFQQRSGAFRVHEQVEIVAASDSGLRVRRENGSEQTFRPRSGGSFDVGERREIAVSPGDQLLFQANRKLGEGSDRSNGPLALVNGQIVTVKEIRAGRITLSDGRALPPDYRQFAHGYCVTSHAAQARTVDSVFLVASSRSAPAIHREQFYVSISRGRKECRIFTDDKMILRDRIARSTHRRAALDLVKSALEEKGAPPYGKPVPPSEHPPRLRPLRSLPLSPHRLMEITQRVFRQLVTLSQKLRRIPAVGEIPGVRQEAISAPSIRQGGHQTP